MMGENCKVLVSNLLSGQITITITTWNAAHVPDSVCLNLARPVFLI